MIFIQPRICADETRILSNMKGDYFHHPVQILGTRSIPSLRGAERRRNLKSKKETRLIVFSRRGAEIAEFFALSNAPSSFTIECYGILLYQPLMNTDRTRMDPIDTTSKKLSEFESKTAA